MSSPFISSLLPNYHDGSPVWFSSEKALRKIIGVLGILLPILLPFVASIGSLEWVMMPSISHFYYTFASSFFYIIVGTLGVFLITYKGYDKKDFYISLSAGICALLLLILPTSNLDPEEFARFGHGVIITIPVNETRGVLHLIAAAIFLILLGYMSLFQFTKSDKIIIAGTPKASRNRIFRTSGIVIWASILIMLVFGFILKSHWYERICGTFVFEAIAVWAFGLSWMTKGEMIYGDK
jgi:hypothetical protein